MVRRFDFINQQDMTRLTVSLCVLCEFFLILLSFLSMSFRVVTSLLHQRRGLRLESTILMATKHRNERLSWHRQSTHGPEITDKCYLRRITQKRATTEAQSTVIKVHDNEPGYLPVI
ncbi:hypothetical protein GGR50DRAFT_606696 [Xylaria sp. CBS 124048]|nr:hypothetical protein GGR50DRAFT_606696 [Xylaria sp. CBS 124048]